MTKSTGNTLRLLRLGAITAASVVGVYAGARAFRPPESVPIVDASAEPPPGGGEWPLVSMIVPARNEERNLPRLLPSLLDQSYPHYEVIVVDDQSEDATPRILAEWAAKDGRLKVVRGAELPRSEGWMGKPFAMHQGAQAAHGQWLLFTDADTVHAPRSLGSSVAYAIAHSIDLFTITPRADLVNPSERLIMPVTYEGILALYPPHRVNDPHSKLALANGQYMLIRREVYDAAGGAARVKDCIAEDLEFAKAVKRDGFRLYMANGQNLMRVRMYTNLAEVWQGWSKNVVLSFRTNPAQGVLAGAGTLLLTAMPPALAIWTVRSWRQAGQRHEPADRLAAWWVTAISVLDIGAPLIFRRRVDRALGLPLGWTFTQPAGALVVALIMLYSVFRLLTGRGLRWKGRTYASF